MTGLSLSAFWPGPTLQKSQVPFAIAAVAGFLVAQSCKSLAARFFPTAPG